MLGRRSIKWVVVEPLLADCSRDVGGPVSHRPEVSRPQAVPKKTVSCGQLGQCERF
jgi:hypothetical protein